MPYALIDCGGERKIERFGDRVLIRPCPIALWPPRLPLSEWERLATARFTRTGKWAGALPKEWVLEMHDGQQMLLKPTDFGHVGFFPEHALFWPRFATWCEGKDIPKILNLFAYSGGATLAFARMGVSVCHVDASKGMVAWARENAALNQMEDKPIRWIVDDVLQFLKREGKRGVRYDGIVLDPPSFGRGSKGQVFKVERDVHRLLALCADLLSEHPLFCLLTSHTPFLTPKALQALMASALGPGKIEAEEMVILSQEGNALPAGSYALWTK